jgi:hypothetical protein
VTGTVGTAPDATTTAGTTRWRRPRRDEVVLVVTALVGVAVLLWGGDRLARSAAESLVARELQRLTGTATAPDVELHGSSFLLQALRGRYERVDVSVSDLSSGPVRIARLDAELSGVRLPVSELLLRNPDVMAVERATGRALLTYEDLAGYLDFTGRPYTVRPGRQPDELAISGTVRVLGREYDVSVDAVLGADAGALTVTPRRLDTGSTLDRPAELLLGQRFTFVVPLDPLPFGQRVTDIAAQPEGIVIRTETEGVVLRPR